MRILFLYPNFYPVTGGGTVHGYYLAKELHELGHDIIVYNKQDDGFTKYFNKMNPISFIRNIFDADVVYIRVSTWGIANFFVPVAKIFGKKVVAEVNAPSDELLLQGCSFFKYFLSKLFLKNQLRFASAVITVSNEVSDFLSSINIASKVIINGGEKFNIHKSMKVIDQDLVFVDRLYNFRNRFDKIVLWSGNNYSWQGTKILNYLVSNESFSNFGFIFITNDYQMFNEIKPDNVFVLNNPSRDLMAHVFEISSIGLAPYDLSVLCRWGFYNSPLKIFEYLANNLVVLTNVKNSQINEELSNVIYFEGLDCLKSILTEIKLEDYNFSTYRSWADVAKETNEVITRLTSC